MEPALSTSPSLDGIPRQSHSIAEGRRGSHFQVSWCKEFKDIGLPSFKPTYLFLVRIPLDVIHECLRLRLEQMPKTDPSSWSIRHVRLISLLTINNVKIYHVYVAEIKLSVCMYG